MIISFEDSLVALTPDLKRFAFKLTKDPDLSVDLVQDTFYKALKHKNKLKDDTNLKAWLFTILKNSFIDEYRHDKNFQTVDISDLPNSYKSVDCPESYLNEKEINKIIQNLKPKLQKPFWMLVDGFKYEEIAEELGIKIGTVKSRIFLARKELMDIIINDKNPIMTMNDIAKKATADKFLRALENEKLSKLEAGTCIGFDAPQVSYLFNEKYWDRLGITYWEKLLAWVNSGQTLKEYSEKHGKVLPKKPVSKKIIDPVAEALWQKSVDNVAKEKDAKKEFEPVDFTPEMKDKIENAERLSKHPYFSGVEEQVQKVRIDIEINLVINGQRIKLT